MATQGPSQFEPQQIDSGFGGSGGGGSVNYALQAAAEALAGGDSAPKSKQNNRRGPKTIDQRQAEECAMYEGEISKKHAVAFAEEDHKTQLLQQQIEEQRAYEQRLFQMQCQEEEQRQQRQEQLEHQLAAEEMGIREKKPQYLALDNDEDDDELERLAKAEMEDDGAVLPHANVSFPQPGVSASPSGQLKSAMPHPPTFSQESPVPFGGRPPPISAPPGGGSTVDPIARAQREALIDNILNCPAPGGPKSATPRSRQCTPRGTKKQPMLPAVRSTSIPRKFDAYAKEVEGARTPRQHGSITPISAPRGATPPRGLTRPTQGGGAASRSGVGSARTSRARKDPAYDTAPATSGFRPAPEAHRAAEPRASSASLPHKLDKLPPVGLCPRL